MKSQKAIADDLLCFPEQANRTNICGIRLTRNMQTHFWPISKSTCPHAKASSSDKLREKDARRKRYTWFADAEGICSCSPTMPTRVESILLRSGKLAWNFGHAKMSSAWELTRSAVSTMASPIYCTFRWNKYLYSYWSDGHDNKAAHCAHTPSTVPYSIGIRRNCVPASVGVCERARWCVCVCVPLLCAYANSIRLLAASKWTIKLAFVRKAWSGYTELLGIFFYFVQPFTQKAHIFGEQRAGGKLTDSVQR